MRGLSWRGDYFSLSNGLAGLAGGLAGAAGAGAAAGVVAGASAAGAAALAGRRAGGAGRRTGAGAGLALSFLGTSTGSPSTSRSYLATPSAWLRVSAPKLFCLRKAVSAVLATRKPLTANMLVATWSAASRCSTSCAAKMVLP